MSSTTRSSLAESGTELEKLKQLVHTFEKLTGINIRAWVSQPIPAAEYADPDSRVCDRCGIRQNGRHRTELGCFIAYREVIAVQEMVIEHLKEKNGTPSAMERSTNRFVILFGERMSLSDAASRMGISEKAIRHRVERGLGEDWEEILQEIDLGVIGIDKPYARRKGQEGA